MSIKVLNPSNIVNIGTTWTQATISDKGYLVAIKKENSSDDNILIEDIQSLELIIALDIGESDVQIQVGHFNFDFRIPTSPDLEDNIKSAFIKYKELPTNIYWRVASITTNKHKVIREGSADITLKQIGE